MSLVIRSRIDPVDPVNILVLLLSLVVSCCGLIPFLIVMIFSLRALQLHFETY